MTPDMTVLTSYNVSINKPFNDEKNDALCAAGNAEKCFL